MAQIKFSNGTIVNFNGNPTPQDVEFVAKQLGIKPDKQPNQAELIKERTLGEKKSFAEDAREDIEQTGSNLKQTLNKTKASINEAGQAYKSGEQGLLRTAGQMIGLGAKGISGAIGDVITGGAKVALTQNAEDKIKSGIESSIKKIAPVATNIDKSLGRPVGTFIEKYKSLDEKSKRDVDALFGIGELAIDIATMGVGKKAVETSGKFAMEAGEKAGNVIKQTGSNTVNLAGDTLEKTGEFLTKSAIPLSKSEAGLIQGYKANNGFLSTIFKPLTEQPRTAAVTAIEKGFAGTESMIGVQAKKEASVLWKNKILPALNNIDEKYDIKDSIGRIANKISKEAEAGRRNSLKEALEAFADDYKKYSKVSFVKAQQIKNGLDKFMPDKAWKGKPIGSAYKDIQKMFADDIRQKTYKLIGDDITRTDFLDYGNLKALQAWGQTAMTGAKRKGGFGSFVSSLYDTLTIPVQTVSGKVLRSVGKKLKSK